MDFIKEEKVKIEKEKMISALKMVRPGLAKKAIVEQQTHFIFTGDEICTFNDHICIVHKFPTDFACSIPAEQFYKILDKIPDGEMDISLKNDKMVIRAGKTRGGILTQTGEDLTKEISLLLSKKKKWRSITDDFMQGLELCVFSASKDMSNPRLTGLYVDHDAVISSDNLRISQYIFKDDIGESFLIPATIVQELLNYEIVRFCIVDGWSFFEAKDETLFCAQLLAGMEYPETDVYFDFEGVKFELPEELKAAAEATLTVAQGETDAEKLIEIEIAEGSIVCRGENNIAWLELMFEAGIKLKEPIRFSINPIVSYLKYLRRRVKLCMDRGGYFLSLRISAILL